MRRNSSRAHSANSFIESEMPDDHDGQAMDSKPISLFKFYQNITCTDKLLLVFGTLGAMLAGAIAPSIALIMGSVASAFADNSGTVDLQDNMTQLTEFVVMIATSLFVFAYILFSFWQHLAENISSYLRARYLAALMHQEIAYFEKNKVEQIPAKMGEIFETVQQSIGEKVANLIFAVSTCISGIIYGLTIAPVFTAVCLGYLPVIIFILAVFGQMVQKSTLKRLEMVKQLGGISEETLTAMKVVTSFGRHQREISKFRKWSERTNKVGKNFQLTLSVMTGWIKFAIFGFYAYSFYIGSLFLQSDKYDYDSTQILSSIIALITGIVAIIAALPNIQAIMQAKTLGTFIFEVIDRVPIVNDDENALEEFDLKNEINFSDIQFKYPTQAPEHKPILDQASFSIKAGESTAIVGPSGSGKSTIVQLIERFYDPQIGDICFDNINIRSISLKALRESIGYVSQEPVLIMGSIRDNLLYGNKDATDEDIHDALVKANATFVYDQENKLDTFVGTAGILNMSGGQKQRIAIARALVKKPKILILDEATSALDPKSEIEVQSAIDNISKSAKQNGELLTIIMIAHRVTSIETATNLLVFKSRSNLVTLQRGSQEFQEVIDQLKNIQNKEEHSNTSEDEESSSADEGENVKLYEQIALLQDRNRGLSNAADNPVNKEETNDRVSPNSKTGFLRRLTNGKETQVDQNNSINSEDNDVSESLLSPTTQKKLINYSDQQIVHNDQPAHQNQINGTYTDNEAAIMADGSMISENSHNANLEMAAFEMAKSKSIRRRTTRQLREEAVQLASQDPVFEGRNISVSEMMRHYSPCWLVVSGMTASIIQSATLPAFGYLFAQIVFTLENYPYQNFDEDRNMWCSLFVALCIVIGLAGFIQKVSFGYGGENLSLSLRMQLFEALMMKHIGWFDNKNRAPGILTKTLIEDITQVNGLTTDTIGIIIEAILGLVLSCAVIYFICVPLALVVTFASPFMVLGGLGISKLQFSTKSTDDAYKQANSLLSDLIINYRTVISLGEKNTDFLVQKYSDLLIIPNRTGIKRAHISGLFFGYSQSIKFVFIGFVFYIASIFIKQRDLNSQEVFTGVYIIFVGAIGSGVAVSTMPSISKSQQAAKNVYAMIEEPSRINPRQTGAENIQQGKIELKNVYFRYPSREQNVLNNLSLTFHPNQSVAIVGHSGSGKSTIASLLLRFYDPSLGSITVDGIDLRNQSMQYFRDNVTVVMQEPLLFNESIKRNILFGSLRASDQRVHEVAEQANALGFIQQNFDDINQPAVQQSIKTAFDDLCTNKQLQVEYPNIVDIVDKVEIDFGYKELQIITEVVKKLNKQGLQMVDENVPIFLQTVSQISSSQDISWQQVLQFFEFNANEKIKIEQYLSSQEFSSLAEDIPEIKELKDEITNLLGTHAAQIDLELIKSYVNYLETITTIEHVNAFSLWLKKDSQRLEEEREQRFEKLVDMEAITAEKHILHPGFRKVCGLRGSKLSGGQKQRIAIARALIKDPKILILDEATSALDEQSQEIVQQALDRAMEGRTSIVIAHRMSTIKKCDRIVVLHKGKVVEDGTYLELSKKEGGFFQKLEQGAQL